jgi:hypothetical protein
MVDEQVRRGYKGRTVPGTSQSAQHHRQRRGRFTNTLNLLPATSNDEKLAHDRRMLDELLAFALRHSGVVPGHTGTFATVAHGSIRAIEAALLAAVDAPDTAGTTSSDSAGRMRG